MKKLLLVLLAISFSVSKAQSIEAGAGNPNIIIESGQVRMNDLLLGHILPDGTIKNASDVTIGSVSEDGVIKNASQTIVGYFTANYQVTNSSNVVIGSFTSTRQVLNASMTQIGTYAPNVKPSWTAVAYFFFKP